MFPSGAKYRLLNWPVFRLLAPGQIPFNVKIRPYVSAPHALAEPALDNTLRLLPACPRPPRRLQGEGNLGRESRKRADLVTRQAHVGSRRAGNRDRDADPAKASGPQAPDDRRRSVGPHQDSVQD